jgi:predicted DNA binding CopG/RHH family protein
MDNYTSEELEILEAIEKNNLKSVPFDNDKMKKMAKETLQHLNTKKQISINVKLSDLNFIKQRAKDIGISYQNIIQTLLHNYTTGKLKVDI